MNYILDDLGYIEEVSFGCLVACNDKTCTEYVLVEDGGTGTIPEGYDSLIDWLENANIRAYKIVDGNLTLDETRATELEEEWKNPFIKATLTSSFKAYGDDVYLLPEYRKISKVVEIRGVISPTSEIASGVEKTIFTLPEGYRPSKTRFYFCHGPSKNSWLLQVNLDGTVTFSRYGTSSYASCPADTWLPFSTTFTID